MNMDQPLALIKDIEEKLFGSITKHFGEERGLVQYAVTFYPLPTEDGWAPSLLVYMMIQPEAGVDGLHMGEFTSPYGASQELMDSFAEDFARKSAEVRQRLREARQGILTHAGQQGVAVVEHEG